MVIGTFALMRSVTFTPRIVATLSNTAANAKLASVEAVQQATKFRIFDWVTDMG
jgi:hypothetical protein